MAFAHRRLAILDLSANGHQPMMDAAQNVLTYNGEIYNFQELKRSFELGSFRSGTDTEVLLKGLVKKEDRFLSELDGMFAFAFLKQSSRELILAVDPAGKKPLYTYWDGKIFAFASEIKALLAFRELDREIDREGLRQSLFFGYVPWPSTMYRFIRKLPAGHLQRVSLKTGPKPVERYWDLPMGQTNEQMTMRKASEQLKFLLRDAVRKRLVSDVPVGCFLSGGIDSSAVALEATSLIPREMPLRTFAAGFSSDRQGDFYDETKYADMVATSIGSRHRILQIDAASVEAEHVVGHFDEPFGDSSAIPTYLLCRETRRFVKVVLSGDGGDELFGGYLRFNAALLSERFKGLWSLALSPVSLFKTRPRSFLGKLDHFVARSLILYFPG